jgi:hypothetical protein
VRKLALGLELAAAYVYVRLNLRRRPLPELLGELRATRAANASRASLHESRRMAGAVQRALSKLPFDDSCLTQSLVLTSLLSRRGVDSELVIGVARGESFAAHAWVEANGVALLPAYRAEFEALTRL